MADNNNNSKVTIGKVAITPKGNYDPTVKYDILDSVKTSDNRYWISKKANNTGHTPAEGSEWWELSLDGKFATEAAAAATAAAQSALDAKTTLQSDINGIIAAGGTNIMFRAIDRVNGDTDPAAATTYGTSVALLATLSHLKLGIFKDGNLVHELAPGRLTADRFGNPVAIDGTEGDVLLYTDEVVYADRLTAIIEGKEKNVIGLGLIPHELAGAAAKAFKPFAFTPHYTVNAKIGDDVRSQAHCCYNPDVAGEYKAPAALFKQQLKTSGKGYFSQYVTSINSSVQARNKNEDPAVRGKYMGLYHEFFGLWLMAMYLELGTYDFTQPTLLGYGLTNTAANADTFADNAMSAVSGVKVIKSDSTSFYAGLMAQSFKIGGSAQYNISCIAGSSYYGITECLEAHRVLDQIKANNLDAYIGNAANIFSDGGATVITNGTVNLSTGAGMVVGKKYYTVRNVPGCQGMADGVMTAVVNIYVKVEIADGVTDSSGNSLNGAVAIFKFSHGIYRGLDFLSGCFWQLEGCHFTTRREAGSSAYIQSFYAAESWEDVPVITASSTYYGDIGSGLDLVKNYKKFFEKSASSGWVGSADFNASLFAHKTIAGGQHDHECAYLWNDGQCYGSGVNSYPEEGKECVNASVAGCYVNYGNAGRTLLAHNSAVYSIYDYAGGFALPAPNLGK